MKFVSSERCAVFKNEAGGRVIFTLNLPRAVSESDTESEACTRINEIYIKMGEEYVKSIKIFSEKINTPSSRPLRISVGWRIKDPPKRKGHKGADMQIFIERVLTVRRNGESLKSITDCDKIDKESGFLIR